MTGATAISVHDLLASHQKLDAMAFYWILRRVLGLTYSEIRNYLTLTARRTHVPCKGVGIATLNRVEHGKSSAKDISGLPAAAIYALFDTPSQIAYECQMMEWELRSVKYGSNDAAAAAYLFPKALNVLDKVQSQLSRDNVELVDRLAVKSLLGQINLYRSGASEDANVRLPLFRAAKDQLLTLLPEMMRVLSLASTSSLDNEAVIVVRMLLNAFFAAFEIDDLSGSENGGQEARSVAKSIISPDFTNAVELVSVQLSDPRLAYNAAEAAGLLGKDFVAARLLKTAIKIDDCTIQDVLFWSPEWLVEPVTKSPRLAGAISALRHKSIS
jgi:hypothetical protein